jgi:uncharacterized membrane protein YhaH (DUF805 family)
VQTNPYQAPGTTVGDAPGQFGEVKLLSAAGRLGRIRYIGYSIGMTLVGYLIGGAVGALAGMIGNGMLAVAVGALVAIGLLVVGVMLTIQRCHDFNMTGWMSLLLIVPLVALIFWFIPGTAGANRYGDPPPPNTTGVVLLATILPVIFVVGIVAAVALPAYVDYQKRAQAAQSR